MCASPIEIRADVKVAVGYPGSPTIPVQPGRICAVLPLAACMAFDQAAAVAGWTTRGPTITAARHTIQLGKQISHDRTLLRIGYQAPLVHARSLLASAPGCMRDDAGADSQFLLAHRLEDSSATDPCNAGRFGKGIGESIHVILVCLDPIIFPCCVCKENTRAPSNTPVVVLGAADPPATYSTV